MDDDVDDDDDDLRRADDEGARAAGDEEARAARAGTFHVSGEIIGPLKVVLSKDIYEQILQTLDNLVYDDYEERLMRGEVTAPGAAVRDAAAAANSERKESSASVETAESSGGAYDLSLGQRANDVVKIDFKLPVLQIEMRGNFGADEVSLDPL